MTDAVKRTRGKNVLLVEVGTEKGELRIVADKHAGLRNMQDARKWMKENKHLGTLLAVRPLGTLTLKEKTETVFA